MNFKQYHVSKNILNNIAQSTSRSNVTITVNADKTITLNGTLINTDTYITLGYVDFIEGEEYTISGVTGFTDSTLQIFVGSNSAFPVGNRLQCHNGAVTRTARASERCNVRLYMYNTVTYNNVIVSPQINEGSTPLPYEPYSSEVWHNIPHYIHNTSTDTITTLPAVLYPNDTTATVGLKGNTVQSGTPTPDKPIMPEGTGDRTGNVMPSALAETKELRGVTITCDGNGTYTVTGTATENTEISFTIPEFTIPISVGQGGNGTLSFFNTLYNANARITIKFMNGNTLIDSWSLNAPNRTHTTYSALGGQTCNKIALMVGEGITTNGAFAIMFTDDGQLPSTYTPYGYKIPISSAGQTNNIYLGEVETARKIKKLVLTGDENWEWISNGTGSYGRLNVGLLNSVIQNAVISSHFTQAEIVSSTTTVGVDVRNVSPQNAATINIRPDSADTQTITTFTGWLVDQYTAGTPVTIWYVLDTETTGIVNEPIRKIGEYADTVSGITLPTIAGANSFDVLTTLKPSEVTVNYKGWHPVSAVHERENGQWD